MMNNNSKYYNNTHKYNVQRMNVMTLCNNNKPLKSEDEIIEDEMR